MIRVKSNLEGDIHRFMLPQSPTFNQLQEHLASIYSTPSFIVKYKDDEGDNITLTSDAELAEALSSTPEGKILRIDVIRSSSPVETTSVPTPTTPKAPEQPAASTSDGAGPSNNPTPTTNADTEIGTDDDDDITAEQVMEGLAGMFAGIFGPFASMVGPGMQGLGRHGFHRGMRGHFRERREFGGGRPFGGEWMPLFNIDEEQIGRFLEQFNPQALGGDFANIQPATMDAFRDLMGSMMRQSNAGVVLQTLPTALPILREFITELGSDGPVPPARIDALVTSITSALTGPLGAENARRIGEFVRTAAGDQAVLAILRRIPAGMNMRGAMSNSAGRLDVHRGISCDGCNVSPIVGVRQWCTNQPNYDLCERCFADDAVNKEGKTFRAIEYPWEGEVNRPLVPRPPLAFGARGNEVMFLQHILTNMGYMTAADYRVRPGMYGPKTAAAVDTFRRDCGLPVRGMYGVYDDIVAASLLSLVDAGVPPSTATGTTQPNEAQEGANNAMDIDNAPTAA